MHDAAYKNLFSHPRMVEELLRGFAAETWCDTLEFGTLEKLPAEFVSDDLRSRRGDALWRVRFRRHPLAVRAGTARVPVHGRSGTWPFACWSTPDFCTRTSFGGERSGLDGKLPPVLPVVLYNGNTPWNAADDVAKLAAPTDEPLAFHQPSQRYFLLDARARGDHDLPQNNLVSALIRFENSRSPSDLERAAKSLPGWLAQPGESELKRAFMQWAARMAMPARSGPDDLSLTLAQLEEDPSMLAENAKEWYEEAHRLGVEQGRAEERALLQRMAAQKFGAETADPLAGMLDGIAAPDELGEVGDWIIECETGADLLDRTARLIRPPS